ncbi:MAG: hypothetical protein ACTHU0_21960 [Kofleriaceae bacterium]
MVVKITPGKKPTVEQRIAAIVELMANGLYFHPITPRALAEQWGISVNTAIQHGTEARRWLNAKAPLDGIADQRDVQVRMLQFIARRALSQSRYRDAIEAISRWADISGTNAPQKHEVGADGLAQLIAQAFGSPADGGSPPPP